MKSIFFFLATYFAQQKINDWLFWPQTEQDYLSIPYLNKNVIVGVYTSNKLQEDSNHVAPNMISLLKLISNDTDFEKKAFIFVLANAAQLLFLNSYLNTNAKSGIIIYVDNFAIPMPNFWEKLVKYIEMKASFEEVEKQCLTFVKNTFENINKKITAFSEFEKELKDREIMHVYFGSNLTNSFLLFDTLARKHLNHQFFHIDNFSISKFIFERIGKFIKIDDELFVIFRSETILNEFDENPAEILDLKNDFDKIDVFFRYEQHSKLLNSDSGEKIVERIFHNEEKLLVYVFEKNSGSNDRSEFRKAVQKLPKRFIFCEIDRFDLKSVPLLYLFKQGVRDPYPNKIYLMYIYKQKLIIDTISHSPFNAKEIIHKTLQFYQENMHKFNFDEHDLNSDDILESLVDEDL